jgi:hypothetical protein
MYAQPVENEHGARLTDPTAAQPSQRETKLEVSYAVAGAASGRHRTARDQQPCPVAET